MKVYNVNYELIGNTENYKIEDTYHTIEDNYYDLKGNFIESDGSSFTLCMKDHPDTHERICIKIESYKPKPHFCWGDFK